MTSLPMTSFLALCCLAVLAAGAASPAESPNPKQELSTYAAAAAPNPAPVASSPKALPDKNKKNPFLSEPGDCWPQPDPTTRIRHLS